MNVWYRDTIQIKQYTHEVRVMDKEFLDSVKEGVTLLKEAVLKEYSLNTRPQDYKGENAGDETLPADWGQKLKPISGGPEGGHEGDSGPERKSTSTGSQGSDPYIHKQVADALMAVIKQMQEAPMAPMAMAGDGEEEEEGDDMMWDTEDVGNEEVGAEGGDEVMTDDEMGMDEGMDKMGGSHMEMGHDDNNQLSEIVDALNQVKGILSQMDFQKQQVASFEKAVDEKVNAVKEDIIKSVQADEANAVNRAVNQMLKSYGFAPVVSQNPTRVADAGGATIKSKTEPVGVTSPEDLTGNIAKSEEISEAERVDSVHQNFVAQVENIVNRTDVDDLRGAFKFTNALREQQEGGDLSQTLYYYNR